jgi:hypothetical protein
METRKGYARRRALIVLTTLMALSLVGVATASWLANGTGAARAKATTAQALTTSQATTSATLYPGAVGDAVITINNPNPYPVRVTNVTANGPITSDNGADCDASTGVTFSDASALALDVPAAGNETFVLSGAVEMDNSSDNSCQGAIFNIPVELLGASR